VTSAKVRLKTPAKVNPVLEVLQKRGDGYHDLALVFQAVSLYDELSLEKGPAGVQFRIDPPIPGLAVDDTNLVVKAAKLFLGEVMDNREGVRIVLEKKIPQAAGLGGGSSDAAATLLGLEALTRTGCGMEKLKGMAARLGSDVVFFLEGGTALGLGRGEIIEPWPACPPWNLVLVKPPEGLSTPSVFRSGKAVLTDGKRARAFKAAAQRGNPGEIADGLYNGLESAAVFLLPLVQAIKEELMEGGALGALVSGSGPTVFGVAENAAKARALAQRFDRKGWTALAVETVSKGVEYL
jgi:4-diphosphocytidyl-2-C-methyl-D-erythritol kinase